MTRLCFAGEKRDSLAGDIAGSVITQNGGEGGCQQRSMKIVCNVVGRKMAIV